MFWPIIGSEVNFSSTVYATLGLDWSQMSGGCIHTSYNHSLGGLRLLSNFENKHQAYVKANINVLRRAFWRIGATKDEEGNRKYSKTMRRITPVFSVGAGVLYDNDNIYPLIRPEIGIRYTTQGIGHSGWVLQLVYRGNVVAGNNPEVFSFSSIALELLRWAR